MASSSAREEFLMRSQTYMTDALSRCACGNFAKPGSKFCNACTRALNSGLHAISLGASLKGGADPRREGIALGE